MTSDVQRQAFDPFFTTRRHDGGTGLGLHIVHNLVTQQLGGRMMLESNPGQGTTFRIIMPRAAAHGSPTIASDGTPRWPTRTMSST
jgi:signal transduction histidine kinase